MKSAQKTIRVNLLAPQGYQEKIAFFTRWALSYGRVILILTELLVIAVFAMRFKLDSEIADAHDKLKTERLLVASLANTENDFRTLQMALETAAGRLTTQTDTMSRIVRFEQQSGFGIEFSTITLERNGSVRIAGRARTQQAFAQFYRNLLSQQDVTDVSMGPTIVGRDGITFSLTGIVASGSAGGTP